LLGDLLDAGNRRFSQLGPPCRFQRVRIIMMPISIDLHLANFIPLVI